MFSCLEQIDLRLHERYLTLERNIKSSSNSFYDSYLDFQEQFVKIVALDSGVEFARETCGAMLKQPQVVSAFKEKLGVDDYTFNKMQDYTLKVNAHKHKGEKKIQIETVVSYMKVIFNAVSAFARYKNIDIDEFDGNYFVEIFGEYDKQNIQLKKEVNSLKEELMTSVENNRLKEQDIQAFKGLLSQAEVDKLSLEDQNNELLKQISKLKDIKLSSMETKLNKTLDLLYELTSSVVENRAISYAVGDTICGREMFKKYVEKAKEEIGK